MYSEADASPPKDGKPARDGYAARDHADFQLAHDLLHWAAELINGVMERRRLESTMQEISLLSGAKRDADVADQELRMAEKYMEWRGKGVA